NVVKQAAVAVLERLRKNLKKTFTINDFNTKQKINDSALDEILKESSSVPQPQSEVPDGEIPKPKESTTENDDNSLFEVTDETHEVEESVETEEAHADETEGEKIKEIHEKFVKLNKKIEDGEEDMTIDDVKEVENILTLCRKNRLDLDRSGRTFLGSVLYKAVAQNKPDINAILDIFQQYTEFDENNVSAIFCVLRAASKQKIYNSINDVISFINNCKLDNDSKIILLSFIVSDAHDNKEIWNIQDETELKQIASNFIINFAQKDESIIRKSIGCISDLLVKFIKLTLLDQSSYEAVNKIYELEKDSRNYIEKTLTEESKKEVLSEINPRIAAMENWLQNNKPSVPPVVPVIPAEQPVVPSVPPVVPAQPVQLVKPVQSVEPAKSDNGEPPVAPAEPVVLVVSETKPSVVPKTTTSAVSEAATGFVQPKDPDTTRNIMYLKAFLEKVKRLEELYKSLNDLSSWMSNLISKDKEKSELVRSQFTSCFQSASNETNLIENLKNLQNNNTICKDLPNDFENLLKNLIKNLQVSFQNATNKKALLEQLKTLFQDVSSSSRSQGSLFPFSFNIRNLNPAFTPTCEMFNNYLKECINKGKGTEPDIDILTMIKEFCFTKNNEILPWSNSTLVSFLKMYNKLDAICVPEFTNEELKAIADIVKKDPIYSPIYIGFINILSLLAKKESGRKQEFLEIANSLKSNEPEPGEIIAIYFEDEENIKNKLKELQAPLEDKTSVEPDEIKPSGTYTEGVGVASILDVINKFYQKNPQMIQVVFDTCFVNEAFTQDNAKPVANVLTAAIKYEVFKEDLATLKDYISKFMNDCQNNNQEAVANVLTAAIKYEVFKE
ncbi:MAG: hypothetical protein MRZ90_01290, partial [Candidatus Gastranaerophilales bacterium]|nr:hypothetical protein [Candidatus Gastranaerophilales bacterium]